jgi:hypothetical protein
MKKKWSKFEFFKFDESLKVWEKFLPRRCCDSFPRKNQKLEVSQKSNLTVPLGKWERDMEKKRGEGEKKIEKLKKIEKIEFFFLMEKL